LCKRFPNTPIIVRTTIIPGFNDSEEDIVAIANFIDNISNVQYELLAYHRLGESKYGFIGREYPLSSALTINEERIASLKKIAKSKLNIKLL
jgi:pyruvate formate lyase activating enzyme